MLCNLPFYYLSDAEFELFLNQNDVCYDFKNKYFDAEISSDKYDHNYNPELFTSNMKVDSNYYEIDEVSLPNNREEILSLVSLNIRSVPKNYDEFFMDFGSTKFDIIEFSETRLNEPIQNLYRPKNYDMFCTNRNISGGGVLLYVDKKFNSRLIGEISRMETFIESVFVQFTIGTQKYVVGNIYRSPSSNSEDFITGMHDILSNILCNHSQGKVYIMGDFNFDLFKCDLFPKCFKYADTMFSFGYTPLIRRPTRVFNSSNTLIDQIWTNDTCSINISGLFLYQLSDHFPVFAYMNCKRVHLSNKSERYVTFKTRLKNQLCNETFTQGISSTNWEQLLTHSSVDDVYASFSNKLINLYNHAYPIVEKKRKILDIEKPFVDSELKQLIREKHRLYKNYQKYPITYGDDFRTVRNKVNKLYHMKKNIYYRRKLLLALKDPKSSRKTLNEVMGTTKDSVNT